MGISGKLSTYSTYSTYSTCFFLSYLLVSPNYKKAVSMVIEVKVAQPHGICGNELGFGVAHAIYLARETGRREPGQTYLLGEIVHNPHVGEMLAKEYGVKTVASLEEIPDSATVVIRAHGAVPETYQKAKAKGLKVVDATCPIVAQVHRLVKQLTIKGKNILYIASDYHHDEALGVVGEAPDKVTLTVLKDLEKVPIANPANTVVLTQTTLSTLETADKLTQLRKKYPSLTINPHICMATSDRQKAVMELAKKTKVIVIVGSPTSSNSKRLREVGEAVGAQAYMVDTAADLKADWFNGVKQVGVSSGASTPEEILEEVVEKIRNL